jgi:hypothetical protein
MLMAGTTFQSKKEQNGSGGDQEAASPIELFQGLFGWSSLDIQLEAENGEDE